MNKQLSLLLFAEPSHQHRFEGLDRVEILFEIPFHEDLFIVIGRDQVEYACVVLICRILASS